MDAIIKKIKTLAAHENVSKGLLSELSREILTYVMVDNGTGKASEDSQVMNRLLEVLTPVNYRAVFAFFQTFTGFVADADTKTFGRKDKANFIKKQEKAIEFLADAENNIWTWAARDLEIEAKPVDFAVIQKQMGNLIKKAEKNGMNNTHVVQALLVNGISVEDILVILQGLPDVAEVQNVEDDE